MISSTLDQFNEVTINSKVKQLLSQYNINELKIIDYNKTVLSVLKYHFKVIKLDTINSMVFRFFVELFMKKEIGEIKKLIDLEDKFDDYNFPSNFEKLQKLKIQDYKKLSDYTFFLLTQHCENFLMNIFLSL